MVECAAGTFVDYIPHPILFHILQNIAVSRAALSQHHRLTVHQSPDLKDGRILLCIKNCADDQFPMAVVVQIRKAEAHILQRISLVIVKRKGTQAVFKILTFVPFFSQRGMVPADLLGIDHVNIVGRCVAFVNDVFLRFFGGSLG